MPKEKRGQTVAVVTTKPSQMWPGQLSSGPLISRDDQISFHTQRRDPSYSGAFLFISGTSGFGIVFLLSDLSVSWYSALTVGSGLFHAIVPNCPFLREILLYSKDQMTRGC